MTDICRNVGCNSSGINKCSACGTAKYCSVTCQKADWKIHKLQCVDTNNFPTKFLSLAEINKITQKKDAEVATLRQERKYREVTSIMKKYLAFLDHQYGEQLPGEPYSKRSNGDLVGINTRIQVRVVIARTLGLVDEFDAAIVYAKKARQMLECLEKRDESKPIMQNQVEEWLASTYIKKGEYDTAERHCEDCLKFAKKIQGKGRVYGEYLATRTLSAIRGYQDRMPEAIDLCEKAYILASEAHGPVHPDVQTTAIQLVDHLLTIKNYSKADDYARMNYENLTDPRNGIDQTGPQVAQQLRQLANLWYQKPPVDDKKEEKALAEEAENMIRKACKLAERISGRVSLNMFTFSVLFGEILMKRCKYTEETRMVLENTLSLGRQYHASTNSILFHCVSLLAQYHEHKMFIMIAETPGGEGSHIDAEEKLRDKYLNELQSSESSSS